MAHIRLSRTTYGFSGKLAKWVKSKKRYYAAFFVGGRKVKDKSFSTQAEADRALNTWAKMYSKKLGHKIHREERHFSNPHFKASHHRRQRGNPYSMNLFGGNFRL
jgi:hypothetical protein